MEAAVLSPQMMADVNGNDNSLNAELEVKKLQELVRKLEMQNMQLMTRANAHSNLGSPAGPAAGDPHAHFRPFPSPVSEDVCNGLSVLDEVEMLDLDSTFPCDADSEDTWLYASPKAKPRTEFALSPLQWCRQVLDRPRPDVEAARRSFPHKIGQAHQWRGSSPALPHSPVAAASPPSTPVRPSIKPTVTERAASLCTSSQHSPPVTQTCNGKGCFGQVERSPSFFSHSSSHSDVSRHPLLGLRTSVKGQLNTSELEDDSISMGYKLQDLTDVQIMARMQEESLRQDYASVSALAANRSSSFIQFGQRAAPSELDRKEEEEQGRPGTQQCSLPPSHSKRKSYHSLLAAQCLGGSYPPQHSSPVRSSYPPQHSSPVRSSYPPQHSSPVRSSYPPQHSSPVRSSYTPHTQNQRPNTDKLRRSMPNLVRAPSILSVPSGLSITNPASSQSPVHNRQSFDSSSALTRLQSSSSSSVRLQRRVHSVGNFPVSPLQTLKAMAYVSPTMQIPSITCSTSSSIPLPSKTSAPSMLGRSIVPRPSSITGNSAVPHGNISQPVRSFLTPPKSLSTLSALWEASWRDGRY